MSGSDAEGRTARWWAEWRRRDFTWEGLASHPWEGWFVVEEWWLVEAGTGICFGQPADSKPVSIGRRALRMATLQDFWSVDIATGILRSDSAMKDELVKRDGHDDPEANETYHIAHLPLHYADGTRTMKSKQSHVGLDYVISRRLEVALPSKSNFAQFQGCVFLDLPSFKNYALAARFDFAAFTRQANFEGRNLAHSISFRKALFLEGALFARATAAGLYFNEATFLAETSFAGAQLAGEIRFDGAYFSQAPKFGECRISMGSFEGTEFGDGADFAMATCHSVLFKNAQFGSRADFKRATFGSAAFENTQFLGAAVFDQSCFQGKICFPTAAFNRFASFRNVTWPEQEIHWRRAFYETLFTGPPAFDSEDRTVFSAFDGARLQNGLTLGSGFQTSVDAVLHKQMDAIRLRGAAGIEPGLQALESGCRVLKLAMAEQADKAREQMFYRFELIARRKQKATPWTERTVSWLYAATSNYGASIGRPIVSLLLVVAGFAILFWSVGGAFNQMGAVDALGFSASRIFPLGGFEDVSKRWIEDFEKTDTLATLGIRLLASFESLLALVLIFVLGLAVRRKFQIG